MAVSLQPRARQCIYHPHLGETQELYDTVMEENTRKNFALHFAWIVANDVSDEDLRWVVLASNKPIRLVDHVSGQGYITTEQEERLTTPHA